MSYITVYKVPDKTGTYYLRRFFGEDPTFVIDTYLDLTEKNPAAALYPLPLCFQSKQTETIFKINLPHVRKYHCKKEVSSGITQNQLLQTLSKQRTRGGSK